ncbi:helix-turn-helix domain-containing protein [Halosegnis longus]|uniref:Helix-turn-helix domain-containing protein n=1 Tax=Halosegnis longus TaxID=2216012 RepID=A0AAJ4UVA8_9EURY|nr:MULTISPECIES: helix-turn-helix domain-containing protein [Halobacteriales]RNJ25792.1 helix-turn-helix domain-containing protein [Salella cibi]
MSVIARYAIQSDALPLAETCSQGSIRLVLERTVGVDPSRPAHFSWVTEGATAFEAGTEADPTVRDVRCLTEKNGRRLYRYEVTDEAHTTYPKLVDIGAQRLHAQYADGWWHVRTRFPDAETFTAYREWLDDEGVTVRLLREYTSDAPGDSGLTPEQEAVLKLARERGYFAIPRETTAKALAEELGISGQAVSERLRRGLARLTERHVGV